MALGITYVRYVKNNLFLFKDDASLFFVFNVSYRTLLGIANKHLAHIRLNCNVKI